MTDFGRELLTVTEEYDVPMANEGGIELFRTDRAKPLLAWLRILEEGRRAGLDRRAGTGRLHVR